MHNIIYASKEDLVKIASCHISAFPDSLSSAMGLNFVAKMLEWYLSTDKTFLFYIENEDKVIGYCGGMVRDGSLIGSASGMLQNSFNDAFKTFLVKPWLLFHKEMRSKYFFLFKYLINKVKRAFQAKKKVQNSPDKNIEPQVGLVVIGVNSGQQGKGIGSILISEFERKSKEIGINKMYLSVKSNNAQAIKSYEKNGWQKGVLNGKSINMYKILD